MSARDCLINFSFILSIAIVTLGYAAEPTSTTFVYPPFSHTLGVHRGTPLHLAMLLGGKAHFANPQGLSVVMLRSQDDPAKSGDDDEVTVYGVNSDQNMVVYNRSKYSLDCYAPEEGKEHLNQPKGICADERGNVYVADTGNNRIAHLCNSGNSLQFMGSISGETIGGFSAPSDVALDSDGRLYIADSDNGRIVRILPDGTASVFIENLHGPRALAIVDSNQKWTKYREAFLVVIDNGGKQVSRYDLGGKLQKRLSLDELGIGEVSAAYCCLDLFNNVIMTDSLGCRLIKLDRYLNFLDAFGQPGEGDYLFNHPTGIAIYRHFGQLFVVEAEAAHYFWVGTDVKEAKVEVMPASRALELNFFLTEPSRVQVDLFNARGKFLGEVFHSRYGASGQNRWRRLIGAAPESGQSGQSEEDQRLPAGAPLKELSPGKYHLRIQAQATYSSREHFTCAREIPLSYPAR